MSNRLAGKVAVGDRLGPMTLEPITRLTLALYCGGSNDHYGIHVDSDFARSVGLDDVIGHGMLSMAYVGRLLTAWTPQSSIRSFSGRFVDSTHPGDVPVLRGEVIQLLESDGEPQARVALTMTDGDGNAKVKAQALIALLKSPE